MDSFHERLARIGLAAGARYGFALAGGYAVQAAGLVERPSNDVDLFTGWDRGGEFEAGVAAIVDAYVADGMTVDIGARHGGTFVRLNIADGADRAKVELAADWRAREPVLMAIGPVLHPDDAVANKVCALFGRHLARDFIDVDAAVTSARYSRENLISLAANADRGFDRRMFGDVLGVAARLPDEDFAEYGVIGHRLQEMRARFAEWRDELLNPGTDQTPTST